MTVLIAGGGIAGLTLAIPTKELAYYSRHGKPIWHEPRGREAGYHWPQFSIHRGELQMLLLDAARTRLGAAHIHPGHHLSNYTETPTTHRAHFKNAPTPAGTILIGADGIHSALRANHHPTEGPPPLERRHPLARRHRKRPIPLRPLHDHGRPRIPEIRRLPHLLPRPRPRPAAGLLDCFDNGTI